MPRPNWYEAYFLELRSTPKYLWTDSSRLIQGTKHNYVETLLSVFSEYEYETKTTTQDQPTVSSSDLKHNPDSNSDDSMVTFQ
jgi:hypothetical protein